MKESQQFLEANKYLIRYYYIYKYKSFHRAAENMYISSTDRNMKYTVDQLEDFYGLKLIKVSGNKLDFTEFGHILGNYAKQVYLLNLEINAILQRSDLKEIRLAVSYDFYQYYLKPIFQVFQTENPDAKILLIKTNQTDGTLRLINHEIDFIVGSIPINPHPDLVYQPIAQAKIYLVTRSEYQNNFSVKTNFSDLVEYKGAINDATDPFYYNLNEKLNKTDLKLNIILMTSDFASLLDAVRSGFADYALTGNYAPITDLITYDLSGLFDPVTIAFIYRKGESPSTAIKKLIEIANKLNITPI